VDWAAWHLQGGPVGTPARWAATSNFEVGQLTLAYPVNIRRVEREEREGSKGQSHKEENTEERSGTRRGPGTPSEAGGSFLDICAGVPQVPSYTTADGAGQPN